MPPRRQRTGPAPAMAGEGPARGRATALGLAAACVTRTVRGCAPAARKHWRRRIQRTPRSPRVGSTERLRADGSVARGDPGVPPAVCRVSGSRHALPEPGCGPFNCARAQSADPCDRRCGASFGRTPRSDVPTVAKRRHSDRCGGLLPSSTANRGSVAHHVPTAPAGCARHGPPGGRGHGTCRSQQGQAFRRGSPASIPALGKRGSAGPSAGGSCWNRPLRQPARSAPRGGAAPGPSDRPACRCPRVRPSQSRSPSHAARRQGIDAAGGPRPRRPRAGVSRELQGRAISRHHRKRCPVFTPPGAGSCEAIAGRRCSSPPDPCRSARGALRYLRAAQHGRTRNAQSRPRAARPLAAPTKTPFAAAGFGHTGGLRSAARAMQPLGRGNRGAGPCWPMSPPVPRAGHATAADCAPSGALGTAGSPGA